MTEDEARAWLDVPRETFDRLTFFVDFLREENQRQNLVSANSLDHIWARHIVDSAQLQRFAPDNARWLDLGTGAGFPGLVLALLRSGPTILVEARKKRADFLQRAANALDLGPRVSIVCTRVEALPAEHYDVISARAFAPMPRLLELAERFAAPTTRWVLPKGKNSKSELEAAESLWQGDFRLEPSLTDPDAKIIVAEQVRRKQRGRSSR